MPSHIVKYEKDGLSIELPVTITPIVGEDTSPVEPPENPPTDPAKGFFHVVDRVLHDRCGNPVTLVGANHMAVWRGWEKKNKTLAGWGANAVRLVWQIEGQQWTQETSAEGLGRMIEETLAVGLLPIVEIHDGTADGSLSSADNWAKLDKVAAFWAQQDVIEVLKKHQRSIVVNIGNEIGDQKVTVEQFIKGYSPIIVGLRKEIVSPIVIDSRFWAKDVNFLSNVAHELLAVDEIKNLIFSVHEYDKSPDYDARYSVLTGANIPWMLGEIGNVDINHDDLDVDAIMQAAKRNGCIGYFPWSVGPGNEGAPMRDMVDANGNLTPWGEWAKAMIEKDSKPIVCK